MSRNAEMRLHRDGKSKLPYSRHVGCIDTTDKNMTRMEMASRQSATWNCTVCDGLGIFLHRGLLVAGAGNVSE